MATLTVLIVEPNARTARQIARELIAEGCFVQSFGTRGEASVALKTLRVDLLITELRLPDADGLGLLSEALALKPPIACVVVASRATAEQVAEAWRLGACDIVFKPVTRHGLLAAFRRAVRAHRIQAVNPEPPVCLNVEAPSQPQHAENELSVTIPLTGDYDDVQRHLMHEVIRRFDGNKAAAARSLGIHRRTLYRFIK